MASFFGGIKDKLFGGKTKKKPLTAAEEKKILAARAQAIKDRKFGELTVRFNPDVTECDKAGVKFILNDDTNPIPFETPFFKGRMVVRVKNAVNAPETTYWKGKARKFSIQVQGRFKKRLCANNVRTGSYFKKRIIPPWGASLPMKILCTIDPSLRHDVFADKEPWVCSPLICGVEQCSIQKATADAATNGLGPWTYGGEKRIEEDSHLFLPEAERATTPKMGFKQRCHYFSDVNKRKKTFWEPDLVYNFDFLSSRVDFNKLHVVIGPFRKGMAPYMNKQPFDFRATVYDDADEKVIGHLFAIQFYIDSMFEGEVPKDEDKNSPPEGALKLEELDIDPEKTAEQYDEHLGLSPHASKSKSRLPETSAAAAAATSDSAPALPEASASASATATDSAASASATATDSAAAASE